MQKSEGCGKSRGGGGGTHHSVMHHVQASFRLKSFPGFMNLVFQEFLQSQLCGDYSLVLKIMSSV